MWPRRWASPTSCATARATAMRWRRRPRPMRPALHRVLRALASVGVLHEGDDGRFALTADRRVPALGCGRAGGRLGRRSSAGPTTGRRGARSWTACGRGRARSARSTAPTPGSYRAAHPEEGAIFDAAMTDIMRRANAHLLAAYDFGRFATVVDVGGGRGAFLGAVLDANPEMRGILFDQPHVVDGAVVGERCEVVGGSFFDAVPEGADAYLLKAVLHDWEDDDALAILARCRAAIPAARRAARRRARARRAQRERRRQALGPQHAGRRRRARAHARRVRATCSPRAASPCRARRPAPSA